MLDWMASLFENFAGALKNVLPLSPFAPYIEQFAGLPYMSWLNWFIPVGDILNVLAAWLTAIVLFYAYSIVLRWVKAIS